ncbi:hypothetical protein J6590_095494 [Homalodisca vitripennis]|nr:hypothetical protein J6590_097279 [Homalodisca vitripennis]KAG8279868.1 hypothetical protein J6590_095494 [Homalodisca vitripennis]
MKQTELTKHCDVKDRVSAAAHPSAVFPGRYVLLDVLRGTVPPHSVGGDIRHGNQGDALPLPYRLGGACSPGHSVRCPAVLQAGGEAPIGITVYKPGEVRAKKLSITLNLRTNGLKVTSEPPPTARQAGCLQGQDRSAVTHPSSSHALRCLIQLSCDNRCTRYTAPLAMCVG